MPFKIDVDGTNVSFEANEGESVLEAALRAGFELPYDCQCGSCSTCRVYIANGTVRYDFPPVALAPEEEDAGYALACQAIPESNVVIQLSSTEIPNTDDDIPISTPPRVARVKENVQVADNVRHLSLAVPEEGFDYRAGQYLNFVLPNGEHRSFSMASAPPSETIDVHIRQVPNGLFSERIAPDLVSGDQVTIAGPYGQFGYQGDDGRLPIFVAGGTGLAPIKSILESHFLKIGAQNARLYWGVRSYRDLYLHSTLAEYVQQWPHIRYEPVLSMPGEGDPKSIRTGMVHEAALEDLTNLSKVTVYACGPPPMIEATKREFLRLGLDPAYFFADSFDYSYERQTA